MTNFNEKAQSHAYHSGKSESIVAMAYVIVNVKNMLPQLGVR